MLAKKAGLGILLAAGVLMAAIVGPVVAQQSSASSTVGLVRTGSGSFSLDVEGADIRTVLRAIAEFSGRNIVPGSSVRGAVKVNLRNVAWQDALKAVLRSNGFDYVEDGSVIRVDEASKLNTEKVERESANARTLELVPLETRIVKLNYANAAEMGAPLTPALSKRGSIQVEKRTNSLVITDLPSNLDLVSKMATDLDSATPQIEITAKLVDVDASALNSLGIEWNHGTGKSEFVVDQAGEPIQLSPARSPSGREILGSQVNTGIANAAGQISVGFFEKWGDLEAQLQALAENRKANIISNPRITTVDNREAKIVVGQKIPLIVQDVAGNPVSQLQTIGIQLKVTPHLTSEKKIIMDLHPEVSDLSTQSTVQGGIIINTSEADTRVMVDDGQTAVIGGLIRTNESTVHRGVPFLKDIPLIGMLFSSTSSVKQNRELIIFVTPRIVTSVAQN
ncbi:MAG: type IV pilus secretin PilQ [Candidatus Eisenbacteria bacterium]